VDPVRNPYAPGAGQRPPELAGRDRVLGQFEVVLERIARGRPERSMVLTGLRGVGKTVLLNSFRSMALQRLWGTGKFEARPDQSVRRPIAGALHMAVRELAPRHRAPDRIEQFLGVLKAFVARDPKAPKGTFTPHLGIDVPAVRGRADDLEALLGVHDDPDALAEEVLVVHQEHADGLAHRAARTGIHAVAVKVGGSLRRRTSSRPPTDSSRRRMPTRPCPPVSGTASDTAFCTSMRRSPSQ